MFAAAGGKILLLYLWMAASMMSQGPWICWDVTCNHVSLDNERIKVFPQLNILERSGCVSLQLIRYRWSYQHFPTQQYFTRQHRNCVLKTYKISVELNLRVISPSTTPPLALHHHPRQNSHFCLKTPPWAFCRNKASQREWSKWENWSILCSKLFKILWKHDFISLAILTSYFWLLTTQTQQQQYNIGN